MYSCLAGFLSKLRQLAFSDFTETRTPVFVGTTTICKQVGEFVDDEDDVGELLCVAGVEVAPAFVVFEDISEAILRELLESRLHYLNKPIESFESLVDVCCRFKQKMRST